ncbi:hypothetical protein C5754_14170 [Listeria monocytogenes]|uniref:hypothetical protein n=1 Tax=Listeria monocytogenes TaxID=1639 RepID=UPI0012EDE891|nr:hypothetical protein [Listeria monocytogenes]EAG4642810.1 hypothetical protein [Listeria monocytogenes]MVN84920.1 hypothetical protein [Listeria monocytogenes]
MRKQKEALLQEERPYGSSFWVRIAEKNLFTMLIEMEQIPPFETKEEQIHYLINLQRKRVFKGILLLLIGVLGAIFINKWLLLAFFVLACLFYRMDYTKVVKTYKYWKFEKQIEFLKFIRLLIPILLEKKTSLYLAMNKMLHRLDEDSKYIKDEIERFLIALNQKPNSIEPFINFAKRASGTEEALLMLRTLFAYQQKSNDPTIIKELGELSNEQLMGGVDEIIRFKTKRFGIYPSLTLASIFFIVIGYTIAMLLHGMQAIHL